MRSSRQKPTPLKYCRSCGVKLDRKRFGKRLESMSVFMRRQSCEISCGQTVGRDLSYLTDRSTVDESGCWIWDLHLDEDGYGRAAGIDGSRAKAHRVAYEIGHGPIPDDMTVDHLCFVPSCVNPEHLRLLSADDNRANQRSATKTHCVNGHEYTPDNTYFRSGGRQRDCRRCGVARTRKYLERKKAS